MGSRLAKPPNSLYCRKLRFGSNFLHLTFCQLAEIFQHDVSRKKLDSFIAGNIDVLRSWHFREVNVTNTHIQGHFEKSVNYTDFTYEHC